MTPKKALGNVSSWQKALQDASVAISDVQQAHEFASTKTLLPQFHDKKFRLLCRKTQFNNQLNKHTTTVSSLCEHCESNLKTEVKETLVHALWDCSKVRNVYEETLQALNITNLTQLPLTAQQVILYDSFTTAKTLINSIWLLLICLILNNKYNNTPIKINVIAEKIKREIRDTNKAFPKKNLNLECKYLSLDEFLASHEAEGFHWTTHKTSAVLQT